MSQAPFSNEVALRIGLAVRVLPSASVGDLIEALEGLSDGSIDEASLSKVTVTQLKAAFNQSYDVDGDEESETDFRSKDIAAFLSRMATVQSRSLSLKATLIRLPTTSAATKSGTG